MTHMLDNDVVLGTDDNHIVIPLLEDGYVMIEHIAQHVLVHLEVIITIIHQQ